MKDLEFNLKFEILLKKKGIPLEVIKTLQNANLADLLSNSLCWSVDGRILESTSTGYPNIRNSIKIIDEFVISVDFVILQDKFDLAVGLEFQFEPLSLDNRTLTILVEERQ